MNKIKNKINKTHGKQLSNTVVAQRCRRNPLVAFEKLRLGFFFERLGVQVAADITAPLAEG